MGVILDKFKLSKKEETKTIRTIIRVVFSIIVILTFLVTPFLHNRINHTIAQIIWYLSFIYILYISIWPQIKTKTPTFEDQHIEFICNWGERVLISTMLSAFIFNYYEIDYFWHWVVFISIAICAPIFIYNLIALNVKNRIPETEEEKRILTINIFKILFLCWFLDAFYLSIVNNSLFCTFLFGILSMLIIFFNVTNAFLNGDKSLLFLIVLEFLVGIGLSVYLIYIIPNNELKTIVLTILASLIGGFLTLVGVAWTFKKADNDRYENDRKQAKPFIGVIPDMSDKATVAYKNPIHFCKKDHGDSLQMKLHCYLQNSDKCIFYFDKVRVDCTDYYPDSSMFINKNEVFSIFIMEELQWEAKDKTIQIFVTDVNYEQRIFEITPGAESHYSKIVEVVYS